MNIKNKFDLILASRSPRRRELLGMTKLPFLVIPAQVEEVSEHTNPVDHCISVTEKKGVDVYNFCESFSDFGETFFPLVISSDTLISFEDEILGIPMDVVEAREILQKLSGKTHQVITAVSFMAIDRDSQKLKIKSFIVQQM